MTRIPPIVLVAVAGAIAAFALLQVQFSTSLYEMLPKDLPEVQGMDRLNRFFGRDGQLIVTVKSEDPLTAEEAVRSLAAHLAARTDLVEEVFRELSLADLVTEGGELLAWLWLNGPPDALEALAGRLGQDEAEGSARTLAEALDVLMAGFFDEETLVTSYDPLGFAEAGRIAGEGGRGGEGEGDAAGPDPMTSPDGSFHLVYVEGAQVNFSNYREAAAWLHTLREAVSEWEASWRRDRPDEVPVKVGLTGTPAFMAEVGSAMERDMTLSVAVTMALIALLFWIMHRQTKPLAWLVSAMFVVLSATILFGGIFFGDLSVMSAGFAAILMGLAVDYGIVVYREAMVAPSADGRALRRTVGPSIAWAAATTAVVFLSLNLSSLPGLREMGNLVAGGVAIGALVMLFGFAPVALRFQSPKERAATGKDGRPRGLPLLPPRLAGALATLVPLAAVGAVLLVDFPRLEANFHPFRIRESPSMVSWRQIQEELKGRENAVPVVLTADSPEALHAQLERLEARFSEALESGLLSQYLLPGGFIPNPARQATNAPALSAILGEEERLLAELEAAGFSEEGTALTRTVFETWRQHLEARGDGGDGEAGLPDGRLAAWSVNRLYAERDGAHAALATAKPTDPRDRAWVEAVSDGHAAAASLGSLGTALNERIREDMRRIFLPMMAFLAAMLYLVFRSWRDLVLSLFTLLFAGTGMVLVTLCTPMSWNSFNLFGLPLLFGIGLDFSIHMIFALRRSGGELKPAMETIGKALVFCGTSSAIGFGSLAAASAHGLASLGVVCATGIVLNMVAAVWLLPHWYRWLHRCGAARDAKA